MTLQELSDLIYELAFYTSTDVDVVNDTAVKLINTVAENNGGFSFPVHARVNVLTADSGLHNFSLDHRKIFAGGNEFFGTCKNPLYGVKFSISQDEIEKLDENIKRHYHDIISRIAAG